MQLLEHVALTIAPEGASSKEFSVASRRQILSVSFWEGIQLVRMPVAQCGKDVPLSKSFVELTSQLLSAISGDAKNKRCGGSNFDFVKALDKSPSRKAGIQYPFRLTPLHFEHLLQKPSFSVMGKIDMFLMPQILLLRLKGLLDERWVQSTQLLRRVKMNIGRLIIHIEFTSSCIFM